MNKLWDGKLVPRVRGYVKGPLSRGRGLGPSRRRPPNLAWLWSRVQQGLEQSLFQVVLMLAAGQHTPGGQVSNSNMGKLAFLGRCW